MTSPNRAFKMNSHLLAIEHLSVFLNDTPLFEDLALGIRKGEKLTLTGPSGSGKSTLLRCILGFVPFTGTIRINGISLDARSVWHLRRNIAYVAQEPDLGDGLVEEVFRIPLTYRANRTLSWNPGEVDALFEAFLLSPGLRAKELSTLSGGERQRIALIAALLLRRPILLLDEAGSALDSAAKQRVREYLVSRTDLTILSVSHDVREFAFPGEILNLTELSGSTTS